MEQYNLESLFEGTISMSDSKHDENNSNELMNLCQLFPDLFDLTYKFNEVNCDTSSIHYMPKPLAQMNATINNRYPKINRNFISSTLILYLLQNITARRVKYIEANNSDTGYPNYYAINFMPSGTGKDRTLKDLNKYFNCYLKNWFKCEVETYQAKHKERIEKEAKRKYPDDAQERQRNSYIKEKSKIRLPMLETSDGTREGLHSDAKALKDAGFGSLTVQMSEYGHFMNNPTNEQVQYTKQIYTAYDGIITSKSIKTEEREENITDFPVNILFHSDHTLFEYDLKKGFNSLLETGLGRRAVITFMDKPKPCERQKDPKKALEEQRQYFRDMAILGYKLFAIIEKIEFGAKFKMTDETFETVLFPYTLELDTLADKEENKLLKQEIQSRELKAIKVSCGYACVNHPTEHFIYPDDMRMAIDTIEELSKDFYKFCTHTPKHEDMYDKGFNFFLEHEGSSYKKNELITSYREHFGLSRDKFKENFDKYIDMVKEIAVSKGYFLNEIPINHNSGNEFKLIRIKNQELSDFVVPLEKLLND